MRFGWFFAFFIFFWFLSILGPPYCGICATIRIVREMLCLPYAGFFFVPSWVTLTQMNMISLNTLIHRIDGLRILWNSTKPCVTGVNLNHSLESINLTLCTFLSNPYTQGYDFIKFFHQGEFMSIYSRFVWNFMKHYVTAANSYQSLDSINLTPGIFVCHCNALYKAGICSHAFNEYTVWRFQVSFGWLNYTSIRV